METFPVAIVDGEHVMRLQDYSIDSSVKGTFVNLKISKYMEMPRELYNEYLVEQIHIDDGSRRYELTACYATSSVLFNEYREMQIEATELSIHERVQT